MLVFYLWPWTVYFLNSFSLFEGGRIIPAWSLDTYRQFFTDTFYYRIIGQSLRLALVVTILAVVLGYALAYALSTRVTRPSWRAAIGVLLFSPLVVSVVVRTYGWLILLADRGLANTFLTRVGIVDRPVPLLFSQTAVVISLTHILLPFAVFPIFSVLDRMDRSLKEAAQDLGAGWWQSFRHVTLPLTVPGVAAAAMICFTLALSAFVTPQLLGGGRVLVLPLTVYNTTVEINWPTGAVAGLILLVLSVLAVMALNAVIRRLPSSTEAAR